MSVDGSPGKVDREPEASGAGMEPAGVGAPLEEKALVGGGGSVSEHVRTLLVSLADLPDLDGSPDDWRNAGAEMGRSKYQAAKKWANAFGVCLLYVEQGVKEAEKANAQTEEAA